MTRDDWNEWIGRDETVEDWLDPRRAEALHAALDLTGLPPRAGDALPPLWHWLYCWPTARGAELGHDGHVRLGIGLVPELGEVRRMWAGSRIELRAPLRLGNAIRRHSTLDALTEKAGRSGRLIFATIRHEYAEKGTLALVEWQDIVYREPQRPGTPDRPGDLPPEATIEETYTPSRALLFRYSALTYNSHRIHYDADYTREVEGYGGIVVHGPLLATLMVGLVARTSPRPIAWFQFRGQRPVLDTAPFRVCAAPQGDVCRTWVVGGDGYVSMVGEARFAAG